MLKFAQFGPAQADEPLESGLDRAKLRGEYEAALGLLEEHRFDEAKNLLRRLVEIQPPAGASRDEVWLRRFRLLCWRNLALAHQPGEEKEALESLKAALFQCVRKESKEPKDFHSVSLWRQLADAAVAAGDWEMATQALQQCLCFWPGEAMLLKALAQSSLRLGDFPRCQQALSQLAMNGALDDREKWLQLRLKRRFQVPLYSGATEASEVEFQTLNFARAKQRRIRAVDGGIMPAPEGHCLMRLSILDLLQSLRAMAVQAVPPFRQVYFYFTKSEDTTVQEEAAPIKEGDALSRALLEAFRGMLVKPWPRGGSASRWLLQSLESQAESIMTEESMAVSSFLCLQEEGSMAKSKSQCFRTWLFEALRFTAEHWHDILRTSMHLSQLTCLQVELLHAAVLLSHPTISSEGNSNITLGRNFWGHSWFLSWVEQPLRPGESAEPRSWLRDFVLQHGLALADACVTVSKAVQWLSAAGRSLLRAYLFWHPTFGLSAVDMGHLRAWLEGALGFDNKLGQLNEVNEARVAEAVHRAAGEKNGDLLRLMSAGAQLLDQAQQVLPLSRCLALSKFGALTELTPEKLENRLQKLKETLASRETPDEAKAEPPSDANSCRRFIARLEKDEMEALLRRSMEDLEELPSPTMGILQAAQQVQNRIFDCENSLTDHISMVPSFMSFVAKLLKKSVLDLSEMAEDEWPQVHSSYFLMLIRCTLFGVQILDSAPKAKIQESNSTPLLHGLRDGVFLKPVVEQVAILSLCIAVHLCERILNHRIARDWSLLAHSSIVLGLKCLGTLLVGCEEAKGEARGGLLLARGSSETLSMRQLWQRLSRLLTLGHDLTLELTENFVNTPGSNFLAEQELAFACAIIFGQYRRATHRRLSASKETLMLMPQLVMTLCLRADCPMLRRWRGKCISWQKQVQGDPPREWKAGFRGWLQEEVAADGCPEDLPEDDETCRLLGRAMLCLWPLPIQLDPKAKMTGRSNSLCRILTRNLAYITGIKKKITSYSDLDEADSVVVPHILSLAAEVHGGPRPQDEVFWQAAATQLDHQLFPDQALSQVLFHPLMMNGCLLHLICSEVDPLPAALDSYGNMFAQRVKNHDDVAKTEDLHRDLKDSFSDAATQARAQTYAELIRLRDALSKEDVEVAKRQTGKATRSDEEGQFDRLLKLELEELSLAADLQKTALSVRPFTTLPFANPYLELAMRHTQHLVGLKDMLQVIPCLIKALAISPQHAELWDRTAEVFAQIYILQDDAECAAGELFHRFEVLSSTPRLRFLYSQAKVLNLMRQSAIREAIKVNVANAAGLARQWFERRLDLLQLLMLRRRYVKGDAKMFLRRCQHLAKSLLWFMLHCTDYGDVLTYTATVLDQAAETVVAPAEWRHLGDPSCVQPILRFRTEGAIPTAYLWYLPYILARIEWKLYKLRGDAVDHGALNVVLGYLNDACHVEAAVRAQHQALAVEGLVPKMTPRKHQSTDFTYGVCEPWFRLQKLRVQLCLRDEGWRSAATKPFGFACESLNDTVADAIQGLDACVIFDKSYQHKVDVLKATIELHFKEWDNASQWVTRLFTGINEPWKHSAVGHSHDPWLKQERRRRKEESEKLRSLFLCLGFYKGLLQECLPGCQVSVPTDLKAFSRLEASFKAAAHGLHALGNVHPGHRTKVHKQIQSLSSDRPLQWQALHEVTKKLTSYATRVVDLSDNFRSFTALLLMRALREGCTSMAKARLPQSKGDERPCIDWQMFQTFTHFCEDCENTWGVEVKEMRQEIEKLQESVVTAALRLYKHAFAAAKLTPTAGRQVPRFTDAKAFLETFTT